ncbi:MAG: ABC transporter permease [Alcaligenaceae bacterium]
MSATKKQEHESSRPKSIKWYPPREGLVSVLIAIVLMLGAECAAHYDWISPLMLPAPSAVWLALIDGLQNGGYSGHILSSVRSMLAGFFFATVLAVALAGVLASRPWLEGVVTPFIVAFQSMPKIAVAPLIIIWLGFGDLSKITIVTISCFFPILINTLQGLKIRDRDQFELFQSLGASRWQLFYRLRLPNSMPYFFVGVHVGMIFALIGTVVAEFVGTDAGLGYLIMQSKAQFDVPGVFACLGLLMLLGVTLHFLMRRIEIFASRWSSDVSRVAV